ncbi:MAG: hypothetical protein V3T39_06330, partial [Gammaproteobacteria bacterium]
MYVGRLYPVFFLLITTSGTLNAEPRVYTSDELDALLDPARVERVKRQHVSSYDKSATTQVVLLKAFSSDQTDDPATEFLLFET